MIASPRKQPFERVPYPNIKSWQEFLNLHHPWLGVVCLALLLSLPFEQQERHPQGRNCLNVHLINTTTRRPTISIVREHPPKAVSVTLLKPLLAGITLLIIAGFVKYYWPPKKELLRALEEGKIERATQLMHWWSWWLDFNATNNEGATPLYIACKRGYSKIVKLLLLVQGIKVNQPHKSGATPLLVACEKGDHNIVSQLLAVDGIAVNQADAYSYTPLSTACYHGYDKVVSHLLNYQPTSKAKREAVTSRDKIDKREEAKADSEALSQEYLDINLPMEDKDTPFYIACQKGHSTVVDLLLKIPKVALNQPIDNGTTPFGIACYNGHSQVVQLLLDDQRVVVDQPDNRGRTPLYDACEAGHSEIVTMLLEDNRVNLNQPDQHGQTPFSKACEQGNHAVVAILLDDHRIKVNQPMKDQTTPLHIACAKGNSELVTLLLKNHRIERGQRNKEGKTPYQVAIEEGNNTIVELFTPNTP